jgi:hypothetical protein
VAGALTFGRRAVLALLLGGCARVTHGHLPAPFGAPVTAPERLRVVIFELGAPDIPFHSGLIVHHGGEVIIFDPAGSWELGRDQCGREGEVLTRVTPAAEEAYLNRAGVAYGLGAWVTHVFDIAVPAPVAALAAERARTSGPVPPLRCAQAVSTLLSGLPGFEDIEPAWVTAELLNALLLHPGVTYSRRDLQTAQSG